MQNITDAALELIVSSVLHIFATGIIYYIITLIFLS